MTTTEKYCKNNYYHKTLENKKHSKTSSVKERNQMTTTEKYCKNNYYHKTLENKLT